MCLNAYTASQLWLFETIFLYEIAKSGKKSNKMYIA